MTSRFVRPVSRILAAALFLVAAAYASHAANARVVEGSDQMSPSPRTQTSALSPNLIPSISDPSASMIVAKIEARTLAPGDSSASERGTLKLSVARVIHSENLKERAIIEISFERVKDVQIRVLNRVNQWNALPLNEGDLMLIAVKPDDPPKTYTALAAQSVSSSSDSEADAALQCYRIELLSKDPMEQRKLVAQALESNDDLLKYYALDLIVGRHAFVREVGAALIEAAMNSERVPANAKPDLGFRLAGAGYFDATKGVEPVNLGIASAIAKQLVSSHDAKSKGQWTGFLSSCLSREFSSDSKLDRDKRFALVREIREPSSQQIISALNLVAQDSSDQGAARQAKKLLEIWQTAFGPSR
jgi:hypothetical protein